MAIKLDGLAYSEVCEILAADGVSDAHGLPLFRWLQCGGTQEFPGPLRRWFDRRNADELTSIRVTGETESSDGLTRKMLLKLEDGEEVESVLMGFPGRFTACLSTQVGCAMGCVFCATGQMGFRRHLKASEIVAQARHVGMAAQAIHGDRVRNLVMMGMGEPLHNFDETMRALDALTDSRGMNIGATRVSISTVGHVPGILRLARYPKRYSLAVSLHGATDVDRQRLIPINKRWPLADLTAACREYSSVTGQKVFIAWTLIDGVNDDSETARRLGELLAGMNVQVNLIPLNPTKGFNGQESNPAAVKAFQEVLQESGLPVTVRQKRGIDVAAGCGQLTTAARH